MAWTQQLQTGGYAVLPAIIPASLLDQHGEAVSKLLECSDCGHNRGI